MAGAACIARAQLACMNKAWSAAGRSSSLVTFLPPVTLVLLLLIHHGSPKCAQMCLLPACPLTMPCRPEQRRVEPKQEPAQVTRAKVGQQACHVS
eukprot:440588-Pelagomonas_calceolata.AAC.4